MNSHKVPFNTLQSLEASQGTMVKSLKNLFEVEGFDANYYLRSYPEVSPETIDPIEHFLNVGWKQGRNPSAHFDTVFYRMAVSGATHPELCPLVHFNAIGRELGAPRNRSEFLAMGGYSPPAKELIRALPTLYDFFDEPRYLERYQILLENNVTALEHYLTKGWLEGKSPSERFDSLFYRQSFQCNDRSDICPILHFLLYGKKAGLPINFEEALSKKTVLASEQGNDAAIRLIGALDRETIIALTAPYFNSDYYLKEYSDVSNAGVDPLWHFLEFGWKEGRNPSESFNLRWYEDKIGGNLWNSCNLLIHYAVIGRAREHSTSQSMTFLRLSKEADAVFSDQFRFLLGKLGFDLTLFHNLDYLRRFVIPIFSAKETRIRHAIDASASDVEVFVRYLILDFPKGIPPGPIFSETYYLDELTRNLVELPAINEAPFHHWLTKGIAAGISPTPGFSPEEYLSLNPDLKSYPNPLIEHFIAHGQFEGRPFNRITRVAASKFSSFSDLHITRARIFCEATSSQSEARIEINKMRDFVGFGGLEETVHACAKLEPEIRGVEKQLLSFLPPWHDGGWTDFEQVLGAIPRDDFNAIVIVPHCKLGGSDYVAGMLTSFLSEQGRVLLIRTDHSEWARPDWFPNGVPTIDLSKFFNAVDHTMRLRMLYQILVSLRPSAVFNVNSRLCFDTLAKYGERLALMMNLYAYYFCADRDELGVESGYPISHFANILPHLSYAMIDNKSLADQLIERYSLHGEYRDKVRVIYSPALTKLQDKTIAQSQSVRMDLKNHRKPRVLWAGRLDPQKRFSLVGQIAALLPEVDFDCWGALVLGDAMDLSALPSNVKLHPPFKSYEELPLADSDGWLFTSGWEGMPTLLIELASQGVPIVATGVGGVPELINHSTGWPIDKDASAEDYVTAILEMISSPKERELRGKALQALALEQHNIKSYQTTLLSLLNPSGLGATYA